MWHLALSWVRFLSSKLEFMATCYKKFTRQNHFVIAKLKKLRILKQKGKNPGIISLTELLVFRDSKYIFRAEFGIYCQQSHRFLIPLKIRVKRQKQPLESLFSSVFRIATYKIKKCLQTQLFSYGICWIFKNTFLKNICRRLLLKPVQISPGLLFFDNSHFWLKFIHMLQFFYHNLNFRLPIPLSLLLILL